MSEEIIKQGILFSVTFVANLFASVSGGGAGFIQFPLLILLGLPFTVALGTHKVAVVFLGVGALAKKQTLSTFEIDKSVALIMLVLGNISVVLGSFIIVAADPAKAEICLGIFIILTGMYTLLQRSFGTSNIKHRSRLRTVTGTLLIMLIGMFSGSISSGAGLFSTLTLTMVFGLSLKRAIMHTMIFVAFIWNAVGAFTVGTLTGIYWQWVPIMIIAAFLGSFLGTSLLVKLPTKTIRLIFSIVSMLSGMILLYEGLYS